MGKSFQVGPSSVATLNKAVRQESLIWFHLTRNLKEVREPAIQTKNSKCKGLEVEEFLPCLRNGKEASVSREGIGRERKQERKEERKRAGGKEGRREGREKGKGEGNRGREKQGEKTGKTIRKRPKF